MLSASSRRIDKCPTPGQRFSDKLPTNKITNARKNALRVGWVGWTLLFLPRLNN